MLKKIETTRFGEIEVNDEEVIHFKKGIPGFEKEREFILIHQEETPFVFFQSVKTSHLAFILIDPFAFYQEYNFDLDEKSIEELEIEDVSNVAIYGILSIPEDFHRATINLQAPVIINRNKKKGKQLILHDTKYLTKTPLFPQTVEEGGK